MISEPEPKPAHVSHWKRHSMRMDFKLRSKMYSDPITRLPEVSPTSHLKFQRLKEPNRMNRDAWIKPLKSVDNPNRNNYCEICLKLVTFCPSIDAYCIYCNVVCHIECLDEADRSEVFKGSWKCKFCTEDIEESQTSFLAMKISQASKIQRNHAQRVIAKYARRYIELRRYRSAKSAIKTLQAYAKLFRIRRMINKIRQQKLRPVVLTLRMLNHLYIPTHLDGPVYVQLTVLDANTGSDTGHEYWRLDSRDLQPQCTTECTPGDSEPHGRNSGGNNSTSDEQGGAAASHYDDKHEFTCNINEDIIIPGINGHQIIVVNLLQRAPEEDIFLGQTCIRFDHIWNHGGEIATQLKFMEYQPEKRFDSFGRPVTWNMTPFLALVGKRAAEAKERSRRQMSVNISNGGGKGGVTKSEKTSGELTVKVDVKKFTHARCGYALASSPDEVCKLLRYQSNALSTMLPASAGKVMNSKKKQKESPNYSLKQVWLVIVDDWMYIYQTFGGQQRFLIHLSFCSLSITTVQAEHFGVVVKPSKADTYGFGYIFPMTFCAKKRREALDLIQAVFTGKCWGAGIHDFEIIWEGMEKAKHKEEKRIEMELERRMVKQEKKRKK